MTSQVMRMTKEDQVVLTSSLLSYFLHLKCQETHLQGHMIRKWQSSYSDLDNLTQLPDYWMVPKQPDFKELN